MAAILAGITPHSAVAQPSEPDQQQPATSQPAEGGAASQPAQPPEDLAVKKGLRPQPLAAGRNKEALAQEVAEEEAPPLPPAMDLSKMDCVSCHACAKPTQAEPCLRTCPRSVAEAIAAATHEVLPQDVILLNAFEWEGRRFLPVPFNHKLHADMAGMAGGCQVCHHHTRTDQLHPACSSCHKAEFARGPGEELRMPSLKGAYHRQCMGCHRDWSHNTKCSVCHLPKGEQAKPVDLDQIPRPGDVAGHPPIENPDEILHTTDYEHGPYVVFRHKEHIARYGYGCESCHKGQACSRCHEQAAEPTPPTKRERHGACFPCHEDDSCQRCHSHQESPPPQRFDHATTGFPLTKYHARLTCRDCHKRMFFIRKLEGKCTFCHKDWEPGTFNHAVTGQILDENHAGIDCEDCHADQKFDQPPACTECHEPDDGIAFPAKRPGPVVKVE